MPELLRTTRTVFETRLFDIGVTPVSVSTLITFALILLATVLVSRAARHALSRLLQRTRGGAKAAGTVTGLLHYVLLLFGFGVALQTVGIDLSALFAAGALFAVALGFAMQSITQNFVAGVILLSERAIKPDDILEVEGKLVKVLDMGIRSITAETRDGEHLIIPNAVLIGSTVKNFTLAHTAFRIRLPVGVTYTSDMALVRQTLEKVAATLNQKWGGVERESRVIMTEFGNHSVGFEVGVWMDEPWEHRLYMSELCEAVWWAFKERGITIAFPQLDVHFDRPVTEGFGRLAHDAA